MLEAADRMHQRIAKTQTGFSTKGRGRKDEGGRKERATHSIEWMALSFLPPSGGSI
jgi:hypothetical protein